MALSASRRVQATSSGPIGIASGTVASGRRSKSGTRRAS